MLSRTSSVKLVGTLLLALTLASCTDSSGVKGNWQLASPAADLPEGATLKTEDSRISWYDGCNTYEGNYKLKDGRLVVSEVQSTAAGCLGPKAEAAQRYVSVVMGNPTYRRTGSTLELSRDDRTLTFSPRG